MQVGARYEKGAILLSLDHQDLLLHQQSQHQLIEDLESQLQTLRARPELEREALTSQVAAAEEGLRAARSELRDAEIAAEQATRSLERSERLHGEGQVSRAELEDARSEAERREAQVASRRSAILELEAERDRRNLEQQVVLNRSGIDLQELESRLSEARAELKKIEGDIAKHFLVAPRDGVLADRAALAEGQVVEVGEHLATLVAEGTVQVVAWLPPERAAGRVRPGQRAWVRLPGFPWTEYGSLTAEVSRVAAEPREGQLRIELRLDPTQESTIPIQHGLPARVEIEIERVAPVELLFRVLGSGLGVLAPPPSSL